jgi:NDP-sugar pyrophosphorylase family protein
MRSRRQRASQQLCYPRGSRAISPASIRSGPECYPARVPVTIRNAVLLAAGRGTRLGELTARTPKPMLEIAGAPLLAHLVGALASAGVVDFTIVTGYLGDQIEDWCARYARENPALSISSVFQREINGTAGAMLAARDTLAGQARFIFGWGDVLMDRASYGRFAARAAEDDCDLLLAVNRMKDPWRGAAVYLSADMRVERLVEKPAEGASTTPWNNAGLFASGPIIFDYAERLRPSPRGELELPQAIAAMIADGRVVRALDIRGFWSDIGTPHDLEVARRRFKPRTTSR